eukprot:TRINITY_DN25226_c0_g1_i1.p1 TRINITY_DN25226_c0_g1~~TRINITY_DN25226_c0_g1_i1.p1  ORF type:complete len:300 (-),score=39.44 TRINITY_DN25226_c0_g1_i1:39-938(-)
MEREEEVEEREKAPGSLVKVASIQFPSRMGETNYNVLHLGKLCEEAAKNGAKIIVLPETSITGYLSQDLKTNWRVPGRKMANKFIHSKDPEGYAEEQNGPSVQFFAKLSAQYKVYITVPFLEIEKTESGNKFYNSISLVSPEGKVACHYRKNTPWPHPEQSWATPGANIATYDTEYGRVGLAICFDIHSILAPYAKENIWTLLYPIAWVGSVTDWFRNLLPKKLKECNVPFNIIGANWSVDEFDASWHGFGYSTIYGPCGLIFGGSGLYEGNDIVYAQLPTKNHTNYRMNYEAYKKWGA